MFDSKYTYPVTQLTSVEKGRKGKDLHLAQRLYKFRSEDNIVYHAVVDIFDHDLYVVKFYPKVLQDSTTKYNVLFPSKHPSRVIGTVFHLMLKYWQLHPEASFIICGATKKTEEGFENKENNTRYRIYRKMTISYMGKRTFDFYNGEKIGYYILVNKSRHHDTQALVDEMTPKFSAVYHEEFDPSDFTIDNDRREVRPADIG